MGTQLSLKWSPDMVFVSNVDSVTSFGEAYSITESFPSRLFMVWRRQIQSFATNIRPFLNISVNDNWKWVRKKITNPKCTNNDKRKVCILLRLFGETVSLIECNSAREWLEGGKMVYNWVEIRLVTKDRLVTQTSIGYSFRSCLQVEFTNVARTMWSNSSLVGMQKHTSSPLINVSMVSETLEKLWN